MREEEINMAIIINLDELMNKNGYTLTGLAEEVGITLPNLSNIKTGKAFPSKDTLDNLCRVLKCQPGDILEYRQLAKLKSTYADGRILQNMGIRSRRCH